MKMSPQGIMPSEKASESSGLCIVITVDVLGPVTENKPSKHLRMKFAPQKTKFSFTKIRW
jgi:hypothetical protein